jgi:uncharacterized iron-regulated protein
MNIRFLLFCVFLVVLTTASVHTQKDAYVIYNQNGERISYSELLNFSMESDITFFGELHDNAIAHWLQLELVIDLSADSILSLQIGMEMFERDQQILIDEYLDGYISRSSFESEARLWTNYKTDYKPVIEFARTNNLKIVATNIPRRYASAVYIDGLEALDSLSNDARDWIAPLPIDVDTDLPGYKNILEAAHGHGGDNLIFSQAVKDATMAHSILTNLTDESRFFHLNGSYHSNNYEGIVWYVKKANPELRILTINTITVADVHEVDTKDLKAADVTLAVPERLTRTF